MARRKTPETFSAALVAVMIRNERTHAGPTTVKGVARAVARLRYGDDATHNQIEQVRRSLRRYMKLERMPSERTLEWIVEATGAERTDFPPRETRQQENARLRRELAAMAEENRLLRAELAESQLQEPSSRPTE